MPPIVRLDGVSKTFRRDSGPVVYAVNDVTFSIRPGETVALIGESGSGKTTVGKLVLGLLGADRGVIEVEGNELARLGTSEMRALRARMQVVFQEPYESLNPRMKIGSIVEEPLIVHARDMSKDERRRRVSETFAAVHLDLDFADRLPAAISGGQQQRVGIARAIVTRPAFIVLDEPTSSLDLSVRAQILNLLGELQREFELSYLFISHDISTVEYFSDRVAVMYRGQIVELGPTEIVMAEPQHPYTKALLSATLSADPADKGQQFPLSGSIPSNTTLPPGCFLYGRCPIGTEDCDAAPVSLEPINARHQVRCIKVLRSSSSSPTPADGRPDEMGGEVEHGGDGER